MMLMRAATAAMMAEMGVSLAASQTLVEAPRTSRRTTKRRRRTCPAAGTVTSSTPTIATTMATIRASADAFDRVSRPTYGAPEVP